MNVNPDILFMLWNCPSCVKIKSVLDQDAMFGHKDGINGQKLHVYYIFSDDGAKELMNKYGLPSSITPALITSAGVIIQDDPESIIYYLASQGLATL